MKTETPAKKALIVTYYWPPSGGSGVQRWLKFVKYLPAFGCKPYIFTPANPSFAVRDESLQGDVPPDAEVIRFPIWEPYEIFIRLSAVFGSRKKSARPTELVSGKIKSPFQTLSTWIRGNFFVPDPRRFWIKPSVRFLDAYLRDNNVTTLITTGPPHSMHLIGYHLKKRNPSLRWLADFRDPWTEWGLLDSLMVGSLARKLHKRLESKVLKTADEVITITPFYVRRFEKLGQRRITLLTNGFDEDDFRNLRYVKGEKFLIRHVGIVNEKCDPRPFMLAVEELMQSSDVLRSRLIIEFVGEVHGEFKDFVSASAGLKQVVRFIGNIPHKELLSRYGESSLLVLILTGYKDAEGFLPGKLFEYLATGLPIVGVGPVDGDAARLLNETNAGKMVDSVDREGIKRALSEVFDDWNKNEQPMVKRNQALRYSRKGITEDLVKLL